MMCGWKVVDRRTDGHGGIEGNYTPVSNNKLSWCVH